MDVNRIDSRKWKLFETENEADAVAIRYRERTGKGARWFYVGTETADGTKEGYWLVGASDHPNIFLGDDDDMTN